MDFFRKEKLLFWCVIVLILLNVTVVATFWVKRPPLGPPPGPGGQPGGRIMEEQLQLSEEQISQFEQIRNDHFQDTIPLQDKMHKLRLDLVEEVFVAEPNKTTIETLTTEIGLVQRQFERQLFHHFSELRNACTDPQMTTLKRMLIEITSARFGFSGSPCMSAGFPVAY